jgi:glutamate-1-semialdehyde 2,1-aminomutase
MKRARRSLPNRVTSPVRSSRGVGGTPPFLVCTQGQFLFDIDIVLAYGPLILGHRHPAVVEAVRGQLERLAATPRPGAVRPTRSRF